MLIDDDSLISVIHILVDDFLSFGPLGPFDGLVYLWSKSVIRSLDLHFQLRITGVLGPIDAFSNSYFEFDIKDSYFEFDV